MAGVALAAPVDPTHASGGTTIRVILWPLVQATLFRFSFHNWYKFRNRLLRTFGATIESTVRIRPSCRITCPWNLTMGRKSAFGDGVVCWAHAPVSIGKRTVISQYAYLAAFRIDTHDPARGSRPAEIQIGDDVWIAAECYVAGGSTVPNGVLVGARSVIDGPLDPWSIATGEPAQSRKDRPYNGPKPVIGASDG